MGADHRWSLPVTLLATPALLLFADVVGRLLVPGELRVSVVSAFIGAPVLIFLVRRNAEVAHDGPVPTLVTSVSFAGRRLLMLAVWSLRSGAVTLDFAQVFNALLGSAPRNVTLVVTEWATAARGDGDSGGRGARRQRCYFQSLMRNPLGSPDVMGLNTAPGAACWWRWYCLVST